MPNVTFWEVLKSNIKCAVCRKKDCPVRFMPERKKRAVKDSMWQITCEKDRKFK